MIGAYLPGNSTAELREVPDPRPGHGEVLLRMKASTICGSDIRCIYHEHLGKGPEGYQGVIAGHEPCGQIVKTGPGCRRFGAGDRVIVYHISACGFGTVYEGLRKVGISGDDAVLITGLGPVGLATAALCRKLGAQQIIGIDVVPERMSLARDLGLC